MSDVEGNIELLASVSVEDEVFAKHILGFVLVVFGIDDFNSNSRKRPYVNARFAAFYLLKKYTKLSLSAMGGVIGGVKQKFDHATVLHGIKKSKNFIDTEADYRSKIDSCNVLIRASLNILNENKKEALIDVLHGVGDDAASDLYDQTMEYINNKTSINE